MDANPVATLTNRETGAVTTVEFATTGVIVTEPNGAVTVVSPNVAGSIIIADRELQKEHDRAIASADLGSGHRNDGAGPEPAPTA